MKKGFTLGLFLMLLVHFNIQAETEFVAYIGGDSIVFSEMSEIYNLFKENEVDSFAVRGELTSEAAERIFSYGKKTKYVMDWSKAIFVSRRYNLDVYPDGWKSLEKFYFPEENPNKYKMDLDRAFGKSMKLKHIYNFEKLTYIESLDFESFNDCYSLDSIILTKNVDSSATISTYFGQYTPAIFVVDSALYVKSPESFRRCSNLVTTFDSIATADYVVLNDNTICPLLTVPRGIIANDTIWKVGESFDTAETLSCEEMRKYKLQDGQHVWCGLKNECIKEYRWKELIPHAELMVVRYSGGKFTVHSFDSCADSLYLGLDSIKIVGAIRQSEMDSIEKIVQMKNASIKCLDMSAAYFAEPLQVKLSKSPLRKIILPSDTCRYEINLKRAFGSSEKLKVVENLDKLYFITNLDSTFYYCVNLTSVILPDTSMHIDSLYFTFCWCDSLKEIKNFDKIENIRYMAFTFERCKSLESITFSTQMDSSVYMGYDVFEDCEKLSQIINFDGVKINDLENGVFKNCKSLSKIELNINKKTQYAYKNCSNCSTAAFTECNASIYLVNGYEDTPRWIWSASNIVYPIDSFNAHFNSENGNLLVRELSPKYCAIHDTVWKLVKGETEVIVKDIQGVNKDEYDALYCGIKNDSMPDYVWCKNQLYWNKGNCDKYVIYTISDLVKSFVPFEKLQLGQLHSVDTIITFGDLNNDDIIKLKQSLQLVKGNSTLGCVNLKCADFSNSRIEVTDGFVGFFRGDSLLSEVRFPKEKITTPVDLSSTFESSGFAVLPDARRYYGIKTVDLSSFENITCMYKTFYSCTVEQVKFSEKENNNKVSFLLAFALCRLDSLDLSSFSRISDLTGAFYCCDNLEHGHGIRYIKFSDKENPLSVSMAQTFSGAGFSTSEIINFDKFTNVNNYIATFQNVNFFDHAWLDTIRFGTDPNQISSDSLAWTFIQTEKRIIKYLPDGVDSLPKSWRGYPDFVVPITINPTGWSVDSLLSDFFSLPEFGPTYAYISDTTWYLILNDYLLPWLQEFGFSNASLHSGLMAPASSSQYMVVDPETVNISEYMDDYTLACVVSNPKYKTLVYDVNLKDLLGNGVSDIEYDADCRIFTEQGAIVVSPSSEMEVKVYDLLGKLVRTCVAEKDQETKVTVPSGVYLVKCGNYPSKKVTVK